eukprot:768181-Hanusia_phi.AAC.1
MEERTMGRTSVCEGRGWSRGDLGAGERDLAEEDASTAKSHFLSLAAGERDVGERSEEATGSLRNK